MPLSTPFSITRSAELDDVTYKAMCLFCLSTKSPILAIFGYDGASLLPRAEANPRLPSEYTQLATGKRKKGEQRKAKIRLLVYAVCKRHLVFLSETFCSVSERRDSSQPWAKGDATDNGSSISVFFLIHTHIYSSLETKRFRLTPVADNRSASKAACTGERKVGR